MTHRDRRVHAATLILEILAVSLAVRAVFKTPGVSTN